ncbi:MAG: VanZ family protein [Gorillibacterium sp.]|nr:VanZ family protein [Gorillibacterium sp.]
MMGAIFFFSSRTGDDLNTLLPFFQKILPGLEGFNWGHFVAYFLLGLTFLWAVTDGSFSLLAKVIAVILCLLYGLTDEFHQMFVPERASDWLDIRNDVIGGTLAMLFISLPGINSFVRRWRFSIKSQR